MSIKTDTVKALLSEAIQELAEINERKSQLDELVANLRKYLHKPSHGNLFAQELNTKIHSVKKGGYRRKVSHATKVFDIVTHSEIKMKVRDVEQAYRDRGWEISQSKSNAYTTIYRAVKDRPDLLTLTEDGYILPKAQGQTPSEEVMT